jgi:hypothetical protein
MQQIELTIGKLKALYNSETRTVTHMTKDGVMMECEVPKNWALTRVFQFMNSLSIT